MRLWLSSGSSQGSSGHRACLRRVAIAYGQTGRSQRFDQIVDQHTASKNVPIRVFVHAIRHDCTYRRSEAEVAVCEVCCTDDTVEERTSSTRQLRLSG